MEQPSPALHALVSLRQALAHAQLNDDVTITPPGANWTAAPTTPTRYGRSGSATRRSLATRPWAEHS
ncbi:MAG: hypothetical protein ACRDTT_36345, partial [Pseudonocardiaceae bacterium]